MSTTVSQPNATSAWKHEVSLRIAAHRSRKGRSTTKQAEPVATWAAAGSRAAQAAARVAARYAQAPSYSEMLEAEAHAVAEASKAAAAARAASEAAKAATAEPVVVCVPVAEAAPSRREHEVPKAVESARSVARDWEPAVAIPHPAAPSSLDDWENECAHKRCEPDLRLLPLGPIPALASKVAEVPGVHVETGSNRPLMDHEARSACPDDSEPPALSYPADFFDAAPVAAVEVAPRRTDKSAPAASASLAVARPNEDRWEWQALGEEPWGGEQIEPVEPDLPIHANLIEFPRELVATRKMRPRRAEGPYAVQRTEMQLSIFEVDPGAISTDPEPAGVEPIAAWQEPDWSNIKLEPQLHEESEPQENQAMQPALQLATLGCRLLAAAVDCVLIGGIIAVPVLVAAHKIGHPPAAKILMLCAVVAFLLGGMLYQALFLILAGATPGMRCARVSLCTFDGQIPTRAQLKSRLGALLLSLVPMGLGAAWALFDDDRLCWHDRLSKTYPRAY